MSEEEIIASRFRRLVELREKRDSTKIAAETAEREYRAYEAELFDELEDSPMKGTRRFDLGFPHGVVTFTPRETKFGRIIDADAALEYFEERGRIDDMTKPSIVKRRLNELVRELLDKGDPMPPGIDFYSNRGLTISKKN
jgi:hypothetical protein